MSTEIKLPSLGEGVESGDVLEILVSEGDVIKKDQSLLEMETDKATVSVPSPLAGKILSIAVKEGQTVPIGTLIATIEAIGAVAPPAPVASSAPSTPPAAPIPAKAGELAPPVLPKAPPAPAQVTVPIVVPPAPVVPGTAQLPVAFDPGTPFADDVIPAGPAIRRFAREVGVDLAEVNGSGGGGRITGHRVACQDGQRPARSHGHCGRVRQAAPAPESALPAGAFDAGA